MYGSSIVLDKKEYTRNNLNMQGDWLKQTTLLIQKRTGMSLENSLAKAKDILSKANTVDPTIVHYRRESNGDKSMEECTMTQYFDRIRKENLLLAPSFTAYLPPEVVMSPLSEIVGFKMDQRNEFKNQMFIHQTAGNTQRTNYNFNMQINVKTEGNSLSEGCATQGTILNNPSAHAALTSGARTVTATTNQAIERQLSGNKQYTSPDIVLADLTSILAWLHDYGQDKYMVTMNKYGIVTPTVDQCMRYIKRSTKLYWIHDMSTASIRRTMETLNDAEMCAFMYTGNLHSLRIYNDKLFRNIMDEHMVKITGVPVENPDKEFAKYDDDIRNAVHHMFFREVKGLGRSYDEFDPAITSDMCSTADHLVNTMHKYNDLMRLLMSSPCFAPQVAFFKSMVRDAVAGSDTDSALFSCQESVEWYRDGEPLMSDASMSCAGIFTLHVVQYVDHCLRQLSRNMGIGDDELDRIKMKSEYTFEVFSVMANSKHYFAEVTVVEMNVLEKAKMEIKGVNLRNSNTPMEVRDKALDMMWHMTSAVKNNEPLNRYKYLLDVYRLEQKILTSIANSEPDYFRFISIKDTNAYKNVDPTKNNFRWNLFWNGSFGKAYNHPVVCPYKSTKIPITLRNQTLLKSWIASIDNLALRDGVQKWVIANRKVNIMTMYVPMTYMTSAGIPKEIVPIINSHKVVLDIVNMLYIVLESLSYYRYGENIVSDEFTEEYLMSKVPSEDTDKGV